MPGTTAISSTEASAIFFREPKFSKSSIASVLFTDFMVVIAAIARVYGSTAKRCIQLGWTSVKTENESTTNRTEIENDVCIIEKERW